MLEANPLDRGREEDSGEDLCDILMEDMRVMGVIEDVGDRVSWRHDPFVADP